MEQGSPEKQGSFDWEAGDRKKPFKVEDGLDFVCETCGDQEGGCRECGFGTKQKRAGSKQDS